MIRGYEEIKLRQVEAYRSTMRELLSSLDRSVRQGA